jgi:hypothetical protein
VDDNKIYIITTKCIRADQGYNTNPLFVSQDIDIINSFISVHNAGKRQNGEEETVVATCEATREEAMEKKLCFFFELSEVVIL